MLTLAPHMPARLAAAAFHLYSKLGVRRVNLDQVAAAAGVTKGSLYHHYRSKKQLLLAACDHYYHNWQHQLLAVTSPLRDPHDRLEAALAMSVQSCVMDSANRIFTAEILAIALVDLDVRASWAGFYNLVRQAYVDLLQASCDARRAPAGDIRRRVDLMLAAMEGIKQRATIEPELAAPRLQRQMVADLLALLNIQPT